MDDNDFIWRIETGEGRGAYWGSMCNGEGKYYGDAHPGPYNDGIQNVTMNHKFGFQSILYARRWFSSIHDLSDWERSHDAKLVAFRKSDCTNIIDGVNQTVFVPENSDGEAAPFIRLPASDLHRLRVSELVAKVEREFAHLHESVA